MLSQIRKAQNVANVSLAVKKNLLPMDKMPKEGDISHNLFKIWK